MQVEEKTCSSLAIGPAIDILGLQLGCSFFTTHGRAVLLVATQNQ